jgi:hypothetical protein
MGKGMRREAADKPCGSSRHALSQSNGFKSSMFLNCDSFKPFKNFKIFYGLLRSSTVSSS